MSKVVRVLLTIAFIIFLTGVIWSFVVINRKKNEPTATPNNSTITTSVATDSPSTPIEVTPKPEQIGVVTTPSKKPRPVRQQTVVTETVYFEETSTSTSSNSGSAWASAGVNPDGSTYAEAHAE